MAYKFRIGKALLSGAMTTDDVAYYADTDTLIDWEDDYISFKTNNTSVLTISGSKVGIGTATPDYTLDVAGDIGVNQYIYHNGDADTWIRFSDDDITIKAGGKAFLTLEEKSSAPHELTINDGSNNIDFVVKGNGSNEGNPLFKCDASTGRVGINGVGSPTEELHVHGNVKVEGDDPRIKIDGDTDSHPGLELYENGTRKWIVYNNYVNDNLTFKTNSSIRMSIEQDGNVGIGTTSPVSTLEIDGSVSAKISSIAGTSNTIGAVYTVLMGSDNNVCSAQLPAASTCAGRIYVFKRIGSDACKVQPNGSDNIDGSNHDLELDNQYDTYTIQSTGAEWWTIAETIND
jgi:hypothetical protein